MYSICFIILLFFALIFPFDTKKGNGKCFLPFSFTLLFFFSAFRFCGWYSDYGAYYKHVLDANSVPWSLIIQQKEFLNYTLYKLVAILFHDPVFYFIITSFIILSSYYIFARRFIFNEKFFVIAFFCTYGYSSTNNITRQCLASSIVLFGILFFLDNKKINAVIFFLMACFIHNSSFLTLPFFLVLKKKFTSKSLIIYAIAIAVSIPLVIFLLPYIQIFFYSDYVSGSYGLAKANVLNIGLIIPVVVSVFILILKVNSKDLFKLFNNNRMLFDFTLHGSMLYIFFIIISCGFALILARFAYYFIPFALLAIDRCFLMMRERNLRFIYQLCLYLFVCSFFLVMQNAKNTDQTTFIWQVENRPVIESSL